MTAADVAKLGLLLTADAHALTATGMEFTALRRVRGGRNVSLEDNTVELDVGVGYGHGGKERLGIRVKGLGEERLLRSVLHHVAEVHDADLVRNVLDDREVV